MLFRSANSVSIADYAPPHFEENPNPHKENANPPKPEIPPTWLSVVGHRQFWPLAYLNEDTEKEEGQDGKYFGPTDKESLLAGEVNSGNRWGKTGLPLEIWGLLFGCLILAVWHWYCCANGSIHRSPKLLAYFAPVPRMQHSVLIFIGSLILAFLSIVLWLSILVPGVTVLAMPTLMAMSVTILAIFSFAYLGLAGNYRLQLVSGKHD